MLAPRTHPGKVHLTVTDLDRSVGFYQDAIGLRLHGRENGTAAMGAGGDDLVVLEENAQARPHGRTAGLYHFALLHPSREELASALQRLAIRRTPMQGVSDHGVSEALYLPDPDDNGIELYADRPREAWPPASPGFGWACSPLLSTPTTCSPRLPARSRRATPTPGSRSGTCTCTWGTWRSRCASTAT